MTEGWRSREGAVAAVGTAVLVALRVALGMQVQSCGTPDACAYLGLGQALGRGEGFHTRFLFDLQVDRIAFPTRGIEYWRPGTSFFLLLAKPFGGVTLHGSVVITVLAGVVMAAAAWTIAMQATGSRRVALGSYGLCLVLPALWTSSMTPDSTLFYAMAVAWFLAFLTVKRRSVATDVAAVALAGVAYMVRNDAVLLAAPLAAVLWRRRVSPGYAAAMAVGFVAALAPVHLLNWRVLGTGFPPGVGKVLFLNELSDFVRYRMPVSAHTLLATGISHLVKVRVETLALVVYRNLAFGVGFAVVFLLAQLWGKPRAEEAEERMPELVGGVAFLVAMLGLYSLALPAIGVFSALRSFVAVLPLLAVVIVVGVWRLARDGKAAALLVGAMIAVYAVSGVMDDRRLVAGLAEQARQMQVLGTGLEAAGADRASAVVMIADPVQFGVQTGFAAVTMPKNGDAAVAGLAQVVGATHVVVNSTDWGDAVNTLVADLRPQRVVKVAGSPMVVLVLRKP